MVSERAARAPPPRANDPAAPRDSDASVHSEDIHVRSYAHQMGYDLEIELVDSDGSVAFRDRYYLQPGATESEV